MGDLYTRYEICMISVVLLIAVWEVPLLSYQLILAYKLQCRRAIATLTLLFKIQLGNKLLGTPDHQLSAIINTPVQYTQGILVQLQSRVDIHKYWYLQPSSIASQIIKTSTYCHIATSIPNCIIYTRTDYATVHAYMQTY